MNKRKAFFVSLAAMVLFILPGVTGVYWFGSVGVLWAFINGKSVYFSSHQIDISDSVPGTEVPVVFKMTNLSSKEISVVGGRTSCDCALPEGLPISIAPGKTVDLNVKVYLPKYESSYNQTIVFMVAEPEKLGMYPVQITATIPNPLPPPVDNIESVTMGAIIHL